MRCFLKSTDRDFQMSSREGIFCQKHTPSATQMRCWPCTAKCLCRTVQRLEHPGKLHARAIASKVLTRGQLCHVCHLCYSALLQRSCASILQARGSRGWLSFSSVRHCASQAMHVGTACQSLPRTGKFYMFWQAFHGVTEQKHINFKKQNIMCQRRSQKSHPLQQAERVQTLKKERTRWYPCARQPYMRCTLVAAIANPQTFKVVQFLP